MRVASPSFSKAEADRSQLVTRTTNAQIHVCSKDSSISVDSVNHPKARTFSQKRTTISNYTICPLAKRHKTNRMQHSRRLLNSTFGSILRPASILCGIALILAGGPGLRLQAESTGTRTTFMNSVKTPVGATANTASLNRNTPTIVRSQLTDAETQATIDFSIALKMRNFAELQQRIGMGELIPPEELSAKYLPVSSDVENVRQWLAAQGFEVLPRAEYELSVFARGTVAQLQRVFRVTFARVQFRGEEHTSAITAPSLPADVAGPVISINGLQPHLHPFKHNIPKAAAPVKSIQNQPPYLVSEIAGAYNASAGDGSGQKIGIIIDTFPNNSDLTAFWADDGVPQSLSNIEKVHVVSGTLPAPSGEETLDASWSSGIAAGAKIRIYATTDLAFTHVDQAFQFIINELSQQPTLHQLSMSFGLGETYMDPGQMQTDAQYFAVIAAGGITIFASSGDGGSSPDTNGDFGGPVQVDWPANDLSVTAVGGTSLDLNSNGTVSSETVWFDGSGGGQSTFFSRPAWQPGPGTISGNGRLVPDVSLDADPNTGVFLVLNGQTWQFGGTSLSAPVWAGFCARLNQVRAIHGSPSLGLLGPKLYPFMQSSGFRDITSGSNGDYNAGTGFDLCTGIGVPNLNSLSLFLGYSNGSGVTKDFNGDGSVDLIWENATTGQRVIWLLLNGAEQAFSTLATTATNWHIAAVGDFLGNGQSDLAWENTTTGQRSIWLLTNGVVQSSVLLPTMSTQWRIVGAGDFNGDHQADLVWENTATGQRAIWFLKNGSLQSSVYLPTVSPQWHIAGVGDFNHDGHPDLVWENTTTGQRAIWFMVNWTLQSAINLPTVSTDWHIAGGADFNRDGYADLVWENTTTGQRTIWLLVNGALRGTMSLPTVSTDWHIVDH
jgi:kumamolisin